MIIVSEKSIEKAIVIIDNIPEEEIQDYIDSAAAEQPYLINYALASGNDLELENSEDLLYYTFIILEAFKIETGSLYLIPEETILRTEDDYLKNMEQLEKSESFEEGVLDVINTTSQPALLSFITNELMDDSSIENESEEVIAEEGTLFSALQIIIDSLNNSVNNWPLKG